MSRTFKSMSDEIAEFGRVRGWKYRDPGMLITALTAELGELAELYLWRKDFDSITDEEREEMGYEFVDVLTYLLKLADKSGVDIEEYFNKKLPKLALKFPVDQTKEDFKKIRKEYKVTGRNKKYE